MNAQAKLIPTEVGASQIEMACDLLLQLAGKNAGRMATARNHVRILGFALPLMSPAQKSAARDKIRAFETKWGQALYGGRDDPENGGNATIMRIGAWLSRRRSPARHLQVLHRAAIAVWRGETSIMLIDDFACANQTDFVFLPVSQTSFTDWLIELRIARQVSKGIYGPAHFADGGRRKCSPSTRKGRCIELAWRRRRKFATIGSISRFKFDGLMSARVCENF